MRVRSSAATRAALAAALLVLAAGAARAADFTLEVLQDGASIGSFDESDFSCGTQGGGTLEHCEAFDLATSGDLALPLILLDFDPDPYLATTFDVVNNGATANFTLIFTASVLPTGVSTLTNGSAAGGGSDGDGNGVSMFTVDNGNGDPNGNDDALYAAMIDGVPYQLIDPHSTAAIGNGGLSTAFPAVGSPFGNQVIPDQPGPAITSSIGITWDFQMTGGGDTGSFDGTFKLKPVPEPGAGLLLMLGLAALVRVGRSR